MRRTEGSWRGGFTLVELLVVVSVIALLIGMLAPAIAEARRLGRMAVCVSHMSQTGAAQGSYAADFQDRIYAFSWRRGHTESTSADLRSQAAMGDLSAAAAQAVDILRRRAGRSDIAPINGWIPHILYSHLVLQDYKAASLPDITAACPEDGSRIDWQRAGGRQFDQGAFLPLQPVPASTNARWPYSSSYSITVATFDVYQSRDVSSVSATTARRLSQTPGCGGGCGYMIPEGARFGGARLADVVYPSSKVHIYDTEQRHFGVKRYFAHENSRVGLLFFDGSVRVHRSGETNPGWDPWNPASPRALEYDYFPSGPWEAEAVDQTTGQDWVQGRYRWTRGGLLGVDVGGGEIDTGQK